MSRGFSLYLDLLRVLAAFAVVLSHAAYPRFTDGRWLWLRELNLGSDAVVVFFVLSGLVIAFVAQTKDHTLSSFAFNRTTRILSVALPALVLGWALDRIGAAQYPQVYAGPFYAPLPLSEQMLRGLTFTNEWRGLEARLGSNGPYWSLSYEVAYYALFAIAFYVRGPARVAFLVFGALLVGPNILLLAPCWLVGVALWHYLKRGARLASGAAWLCALVPVVAYGAALAAGMPGLLLDLTNTLVDSSELRFSNEVIWNSLLALCVGVHLLGVASLMRVRVTLPGGRAIRWLAAGSFSIYLVHYPLLQILGPALPEAGVAFVDDMILVSAVTLACLAFAQVFERTLAAQRAALRPFGLTTKKAPPV